MSRMYTGTVGKRVVGTRTCAGLEYQDGTIVKYGDLFHGLQPKLRRCTSKGTIRYGYRMLCERHAEEADITLADRKIVSTVP